MCLLNMCLSAQLPHPLTLDIGMTAYHKNELQNTVAILQRSMRGTITNSLKITDMKTGDTKSCNWMSLPRQEYNSCFQAVCCLSLCIDYNFLNIPGSLEALFFYVLNLFRALEFIPNCSCSTCCLVLIFEFIVFCIFVLSLFLLFLKHHFILMSIEHTKTMYFDVQGDRFFFYFLKSLVWYVITRVLNSYIYDHLMTSSHFMSPVNSRPYDVFHFFINIGGQLDVVFFFF